MSENFNANLQTLPVDLLYLLLDNLTVGDIYCSMWNVSRRINTIIASYRRYRVRFLRTHPHICLIMSLFKTSSGLAIKGAKMTTEKAYYLGNLLYNNTVGFIAFSLIFYADTVSILAINRIDSSKQ